MANLDRPDRSGIRRGRVPARHLGDLHARRDYHPQRWVRRQRPDRPQVRQARQANPHATNHERKPVGKERGSSCDRALFCMPRAGPYDQHRDNQNVVIALGLAIVYPWLKRVTFWPQVGLGLAFSMAIPMAFTAYEQPLDEVVWALFLGNVAWTLAYDTLYAMVDRDDDLRIGVKSTAIAFGPRFASQSPAAADCAGLAAFTYAFLASSLLLLSLVLLRHRTAIQNQRIAKTRARDACFRAFLENHRFGAALFIGTVFGVL